MNMIMSISVSSSKLTHVYFNIASRVKSGRVIWESVTSDATVAEVFKDTSQQQDVSFKVQIAVLAERSDREPLSHVDGMHVIVLGYGHITDDITRQ